MAITIGIKKFVCLNEYPETDYDLIQEAGVKIEILDKNMIEGWAKKLTTNN
jgi:dCMP deaminase